MHQNNYVNNTSKVFSEFDKIIENWQNKIQKEQASLDSLHDQMKYRSEQQKTIIENLEKACLIMKKAQSEEDKHQKQVSSLLKDKNF